MPFAIYMIVTKYPECFKWQAPVLPLVSVKSQVLIDFPVQPPEGRKECAIAIKQAVPQRNNKLIRDGAITDANNTLESLRLAPRTNGGREGNVRNRR